MRKESPFDRVVFRTVARIVSHADPNADRIDDGLQVVFENVLRRRIAATTIHKHQNGICVWVALEADSIPIPLETVENRFPFLEEFLSKSGRRHQRLSHLEVSANI